MRGFLAFSAIFAGLLAGPAQAWVVHSTVNSCVFTIGRFCPVESVAGTVLGAGVLAGAWLGLQRLFSGKGKAPDAPASDPALVARARQFTEAWRLRNRPPIQNIRLAFEIRCFVDACLRILREEHDPLTAKGGAWMVKFVLECIRASQTQSREAIDRAVAQIVADAQAETATA